MLGQKYTYLVVKYIHASRFFSKKFLCANFIKSTSFVVSTEQSSLPLASSGASLAALSGLMPCCFYKYSQRQKKCYLAGSKVAVKGPRSIYLLFALKTFVLYRCFNYKGMPKSPKNVSVGYKLGSISFFRGLSKPIEKGCAGLSEDSADFFLNMFMKPIGSSIFVLRSLGLPVYG